MLTGQTEYANEIEYADRVNQEMKTEYADSKSKLKLNKLTGQIELNMLSGQIKKN